MTVFGFDEDGRFELQVFNRTLVGSGMELRFTRVVDGEMKRSVKAQLIRPSAKRSYSEIVEEGLVEDVEEAKKYDDAAAKRKASTARTFERARAALDAFRAQRR